MGAGLVPRSFGHPGSEKTGVSAAVETGGKLELRQENTAVITAKLNHFASPQPQVSEKECANFGPVAGKGAFN